MRYGIAFLGVVLVLALSSCAVSEGNRDNGSGTTTNTYEPTDHACSQCDGNGTCHMCYGDGINPVDPDRRQHCWTCGGSGRCTRCRGSGTVRY